MVEEDEYRSTYRAVNQRRCVFEKAILNRHCSCSFATRFFLADREGISCEAEAAHTRCSRLLSMLRDKSRFALKLRSTEEELPHTKEIKVQAGGLLGLQKAVYPESVHGKQVEDIAGLIANALKTFTSLERIPYSEITQSVAAFAGRKKRPRSKRH